MMVALISRCILADPKQEFNRRTNRQPGSKRFGKDNQQPSLEVSGVVYEKVTSAGRDSVQENEGEGNRTAAREYNDAAHLFVQSGRIQKSGERAKSAFEGGEKAELERAEKAGKSKIREEDPAVERKSHRQDRSFTAPVGSRNYILRPARRFPPLTAASIRRSTISSVAEQHASGLIDLGGQVVRPAVVRVQFHD